MFMSSPYFNLQVRVIRLEGLNTSTREFIALEGMPRVSLIHHILQATSEPRFKPLPQPPRLQHQPARPAKPPTLGPPYPVDEASFIDACKRLIAVEALCKAGNVGDKAAAKPSRFAHSGDRRAPGYQSAASIDLLLQSLQSLASFRYVLEC